VFCAEKDSGFFAALRMTQRGVRQRVSLRHQHPVMQSSLLGKTKEREQALKITFSTAR
jgi:hypothetical protein